MKTCQRLLSFLLAVIILAGCLPAKAAGGLNGTTCDFSDFRRSIYDVCRSSTYVTNKKITPEWPESGNVLITVAAGYQKFGEMDGVVIPPNLVVDVYAYSGRTYTFIVQYDTTDGKSVTVDTSKVNYTDVPFIKPRDVKFDFDVAAGKPNIKKPASYSHNYPDVKPGAWYYDAIMTLSEYGVLKGHDDGTFRPDDPINYGQLQIIISRLTGERFGPESEIDLSTYQNKYVVSRGLAVMELMGMFKNGRFSNIAYYDGGANFQSAEEFPDYETIRSWIYEYNTKIIKDIVGINVLIPDMNASIDAIAENYFLASVRYGMFDGVDDKGTFDPYGTLTRAQLCQILYNMGWVEYDNDFLSTAVEMITDLPPTRRDF